ncbi:MAG: amidohydrolase family protein, partial [Nocardioides sp.]|uniref:amidohydrolase family protein n=1 Tax=Nocardioides sp. TaxID=35761 RepID=UPI0039E227F8
LASYRLRGARLSGAGDELVDLVVVEGRVAEIRPSTEPSVEGHVGGQGPPAYDAAGALLLPGFVDLHVHLDKAFQLGFLERHGRSVAGGLERAMTVSAEARSEMTPDEVRAAATRTIELMRRGGTVAARAHVEVGPESHPWLTAMHASLAEADPGFALELCAFPQFGTTADAGLRGAVERALDDGCGVVGGCPYADPDPRRHLADMVALARDRRLPLDLHIDLTDDGDRMLLEEAARLVIGAGLEGRVVAGHATALTALPPRRLREVARVVADAGITVVALPATDLFLSGRDTPSAPTRGVTRIAELWDAGAPVALGSNNHENAFTPVRTASLAQVAWLAALTNHLASAEDHLRLLDALGEVPRGALGVPAPGLGIGDVVGGSLFTVEHPVDVVRAAARPVALVGPRGVQPVTAL